MLQMTHCCSRGQSECLLPTNARGDDPTSGIMRTDTHDAAFAFQVLGGTPRRKHAWQRFSQFGVTFFFGAQDHATSTLRNWFSTHQNNPYPTESEKTSLCEMCNITIEQLNNWFVNVRKR